MLRHLRLSLKQLVLVLGTLVLSKSHLPILEEQEVTFVVTLLAAKLPLKTLHKTVSLHLLLLVVSNDL